jgi:hypothetical protein
MPAESWKPLIAAILVAAMVTGGCEARSNQSVTTKSIIAFPSGSNLVQNGGFERFGLESWAVLHAPGITVAVDPQVRFSGRRSLKITAGTNRVASTLVVRQDAVALPSFASGSRYTLTFQARTAGLDRALQTELKLNYAGGGYGFYRGKAMTQASASSPTGIPPGTSNEWIKMMVTATARFPLESIGVFVIDSGLGPLTGTVWVDEIALRQSR